MRPSGDADDRPPGAQALAGSKWCGGRGRRRPAGARGSEGADRPAGAAAPKRSLLASRRGAARRGDTIASGLTLERTAPASVARARRSPLRPSRSFVRFLARRFVALVLLSLGITAVVFVLTQLVPSNPVAANLGEQAAADPAVVKAFRAHYGLDKPLPVQYGPYLYHLAQGDLGQSE